MKDYLDVENKKDSMMKGDGKEDMVKCPTCGMKVKKSMVKDMMKGK